MDDNQEQNCPFLPKIVKLIPKSHPLRIVNGIIEQVHLRLRNEEYNKDGKPGTPPNC